MNRPVLRLYGVVILLFAVLVVFTSRWTVFQAEALRDNSLNKRELLQEQKIRRGTIRSADGKVLARSVHGVGETWNRRYPTADLFASIDLTDAALAADAVARAEEESVPTPGQGPPTPPVLPPRTTPYML